jgi:long-chain acyl-CoA synthetase
MKYFYFFLLLFTKICIRSPTLLLDYYKNDEKYKEVVDKDGFLHTGDVGMILPNGALKIIDRAKNIFKLSQGEYIAPEKIE